MKEYKLYNKLLNRISPETELSEPGPSGKDGLAPVPIPPIPIPPIAKNPPSCSFSPSLSYKFPSPSPSLVPEKPTVEIEEIDNVNSNVKMQPLRPQQLS